MRRSGRSSEEPGLRLGQSPGSPRPAGATSSRPVPAVDRSPRIAVRAPNWIGDACLALPFFRALRRLYPDAHVTALARPWVAGLVRLFDPVDRVLEVDEPLGFPGRLRHFVSDARRVSAGRFDLGISLPHTFSSAALLALSGIPRRLGHATPVQARFYTHPLPWRGLGGTHRARSYLELLAPLSATPPELDNRPLVLPTFPGEEPPPTGPDRPRPSVALGIGSEAPSRRWPPGHFGALARRFLVDGWTVHLVGGARDRPAAGAILEAGGSGARDLTGRTTLEQAVRLLAAADLVIANDSGLAHVGGILGVPTLTFFGAGNPAETAPLGPRVRVLDLAVPCSPCGRRVCPTALECLAGLDPSRVHREAMELIRWPAGKGGC